MAIITHRNKKIEYNELTGEILVDGVKSTKYKAVFIPNGDKKPTFFGISEEALGIMTDITGKENKIVDKDNIDL
jgi:hypothetical protein